MAAKCSNNSCGYWSADGCALFEGVAWRECRKKVTANPKPKNPKKGSKNGSKKS